MIAANALRGDMPVCHWDSADKGFLLDVRNPRDREILVFCRSAQRACYATRILLQNGFKARNISGGMLSRSMLAAR